MHAKNKKRTELALMARIPVNACACTTMYDALASPLRAKSLNASRAEGMKPALDP
jgi:hypothetical protein